MRVVPISCAVSGLTAAVSSNEVSNATIAVVLTAVLVRGIRESLLVNWALLAVKLGVILFVCVVGAFYVDPANWLPFAPHGWGGIDRSAGAGGAGAGPPPMGMLAGAAMVFYAYLGFEAIAAQSEEARRPQRDVAHGIIGSLAACTVTVCAAVPSLRAGRTASSPTRRSRASRLACARSGPLT